MIRSILLIGLILALCGCTHHAYLVNAIIPVTAIRKPVQAINCTPDLLKCQKFVMTFDKSGAIVQVVK